MSSKNHTASYCPQPAPDRRGEETHAPRRPQLPPLLQVGNVILSSELLTECFCCDLEACRGICCVEGEAGAPVTLDEVAALEEVLDTVRDELAPEARAVIDRQGVAYTDADGDLVTSIVGGRDCAFTCYDAAGCCLCATERAYRQGRTAWCKPISCSLYPIRERQLGGGLTGLSYHRWAICADAVRKGRELHLPLYRFLREPLVRRFGEAWYAELEELVGQLRREGYLPEAEV